MAVLASEQIQDAASALGAVDLDPVPLARELDVRVDALCVFVEVQDPDASLVERTVGLLDEPVDPQRADVLEQRFESLKRDLSGSRHASSIASLAVESPLRMPVRHRPRVRYGAGYRAAPATKAATT